MTFDVNESPPPTCTCGGAGVTFDQLAIQEIGAELPVAGALAEWRHPVAEVGRERVKVELEAIAGKGRQMLGSQDFDKRMDDGVSGGLRPRSQLEDGNELGWGV